MRSLVVVEETCMISHIRLPQSSISQLLEYNKPEVFPEGRLHSIESDRICQSFLNRKINVNPKYSVLMFPPSTVQVLCMTWFIEVNLCRILMPFVSGINRQKIYCLSFAWILTSRYQSIVDDRMKIKSTSNVVNMLEESTLNYHIVL